MYIQTYILTPSYKRYKPGSKDRAVDVRARNLHDEYVVKARKADQQYGGVEVGMHGAVESKLLSFGRVQGIVFGNYGEVSEATQRLLDTIAPAGSGWHSPRQLQQGEGRVRKLWQ